MSCGGWWCLPCLCLRVLCCWFFLLFFLFFLSIYLFIFVFVIVIFITISDSGCLDNNTYKMLIPTAWIPLLDANETNGCLQVCYIFIAPDKSFLFN